MTPPGGFQLPPQAQQWLDQMWRSTYTRVQRMIDERLAAHFGAAWSGGKLDGSAVGGTLPIYTIPAHASTHNAGGSDALAPFTGDSGSGGAVGYVPAPAAGDAAAGKFLKADGTWTAPPGGSGSDPVFVASGASHSAGDVPDPGSTAGTTRYLREDATWQVPPTGGGSGTVDPNLGAMGLLGWA